MLTRTLCTREKYESMQAYIVDKNSTIELINHERHSS